MSKELLQHRRRERQTLFQIAYNDDLQDKQDYESILQFFYVVTSYLKMVRIAKQNDL